MEFIKNVILDKKIFRHIIFIFLILALSLGAFLTVKLFLFYNDNIKDQEIPLYYEFGPHTLAIENDEDAKDIGEQFLSFGVSYGVDVSEWQGDIDWERVRATGITFAIIRCGFRQTHGSDIIEDGQFRKNIEGATAAGLKVGVYFFGTAKNEQEAIEEAEFTVDLIKDYDLSYPVVYDVESFNTGRLEGISYSAISDNILAFTETVGSYGYETMIYSYYNALSYMLDTGKFDGKLIWLAHYDDETDYKGNYNMWQYTNTGRVDGIKTNVDLNISYFKYVKEEEKVIKSPIYIQEPRVQLAMVNEKVITNKVTVMRTSPSSEIPNRLGTLNKGTELVRTGFSDDFSLVTYNGRSVYVATSDLILAS